jgi:hypothetical protein
MFTLFVKTHLSDPEKKVRSKSKKSKTSGDPLFNLLKMKPVRIRKWKPNPNDKDLVTIIIPRFNTKFGKKLGRIFNIKQTYHVNLEKYGSSVWRLCNGEATVKDIGDVLQEQYGEDVEPLYERLSFYLTLLERNKLIRYEKYVINRKHRTK